MAVSLVLLGDLMLGREVDYALGKVGVRHVWGNFLPLLSGGQSEHQVVAANLEVAITDGHDEIEKPEKGLNFKMSPAHASVLRVAAVNYVSLSNTHTMDFQLTGLKETQDVLTLEGIGHSGAGFKKEAMMPAHVKKAGVEFAFFSFSDQYEEWAATDDKPGINVVNLSDYNKEELKKHFIDARRRGANFIVVYANWGPKQCWWPSEAIVQLAHSFIECGADVVFGIGTHHIQGIEIHDDRPIIYGAGSFIHDYDMDLAFRNDLGFMYTIKIVDKKLVGLELSASKIEKVKQEAGEIPPVVSKVMKATDRDLARVTDKMRSLCRFFGTKMENTADGLRIPLDWAAPPNPRPGPTK
ncbi:hypothetical protein BSKO_00646 [Bryopsis sp. KO-2023]|nr:hypothetical protein BSKO_00646 [Bryopsis sp. KO-2023]